MLFSRIVVLFKGTHARILILDILYDFEEKIYCNITNVKNCAGPSIDVYSSVFCRLHLVQHEVEKSLHDVKVVILLERNSRALTYIFV
jgi:hypothetical protein